LGILDEADERSLLGDLCEQRQRRQPDQELVWRWARAQPEDRGERVALREGKPIEATQHGPAKLVQAAVSQFHFRLDARRLGDMRPVSAIRHVGQQGALAHPGLASKHGNSAPTPERVG
jgi:hypothetical protein